MLSLFDKLNRKLSFFSEIIITFCAFFFKILKEKVFEIVSIVFPDLEITRKRTFLNFSFFFKAKTFFHQCHLKNKFFSLFFFLENYILLCS